MRSQNFRVEMEWCEMSGPVILPGEPFHVDTKHCSVSQRQLRVPEGRGGSARPLQEGPVPGAPCAPGADRAILTEPLGPRAGAEFSLAVKSWAQRRQPGGRWQEARSRSQAAVRICSDVPRL